MEMTLTVHVPRRRPQPVDLVVEWSTRSTVADLCAALAEHLGEPVPRLSCRGLVLAPDALVGMPPLLHGASVAVTSGDVPARRPVVAPVARPVLDLVVVGGPDAGRSRPLSPPGVVVGRAPNTGLVVDDDALSRSHVFVGVGPHGVTIEDRGSTNGITVDGVEVRSPTAVDAGSTIGVGSSTLRLRRVSGAGPPVRHPGDGTVHVSPTAGPPVTPEDVEVRCPAAPPERHRARVPWIAAVAPVPVAIALAVFLGPQLLLFAALGPVSLLAGALGDRWGAGRAHQREVAGHAAAVAEARRRLDDALRSEAERLDRAHPDPAAVLVTAEQRLAGLWCETGSARLRLGTGEVRTRVVWVDGSSRSHPAVARAPLVVDLAEVTCLGVVGPEAHTDGLLTGLVGQLCTSHAPHELVVSVASSDPAWSWVGRLPHAVEAPAPDAVASGPPTAGERARGRAAPLRLLVVPRPGPDTGALVRAALGAGVLVIAGAPSRAELPAGCGAVVARVGAGHVYVDAAGPVAFVPDLVGSWWADRLSRALAPLRCSEPATNGRMPSRLTLVDALGGTELTAARVADGWRSRAGPGGPGARAVPTPAAVVGSGADGPFVVDLCRDGPHVLVGGTTGAGKSEFLRTLVTSLAISAPPEDLTFVLVDFKGGAAFTACAGLPHVVGLVTDLDDHLVSRALASLRAELRRRERLLAAVGAGDLEAYHRVRADDSEPLPRLVVVVDELRALVEELPDFVTGLVRLAALGRSLGVHLVLATQRPSGALTAEVQANVSLRIAFRVRDRADSVDVLDDGAAAAIAPSTPGRAFARGADGALVTFQAATVQAPRARSGARLTVRACRDGAGLTDGPPRVDESDVARAAEVVEAVCEAHRLLGGRPPRAPWLAPLPAVVPAGVPGGPGPRGEARVVGLVDEPDLQRVAALAWNAAEGPWLLSGGSGSGRTTALRALALAASADAGPDTLHLHVIDAHGSLGDLGALPHLGTSVPSDDPRGCAALVRHLREEVDRRLGAAGPGRSAASTAGRPTILVLVDGWDQLVEAQPQHGPDPLSGALLRVLRDGRAVGVVGAVTGGRGLLHPRWGEVAGRTFLLGRIDPLDAAIAGIRAADVPRDPPPGRAVRVHDTRGVQFASASAADTATVARVAGPRPAGGAWRWVALPERVRRDQVPHGFGGAVGAAGRDQGVLLGVGGDRAAPCWWRPGSDGRRLVVAGPPRSGRTNALRVVAESLCAQGRFVTFVSAAADPRRVPWPPEVTVVGPGDSAELVRLRRRHPDLAVCVDDADRLGDGELVPVLREIIGLVDRDRGMVVVATSSTSLTTRFTGIDVDVARYGCALALSPTAVDRGAFAASVPDGIPRLPGRGVLVTGGECTEVQVLLAEGSAGQVAPREHLGVRVAGDPRGPDGRERHHDDHPPDEHPVALGEADPDRQEQHVPDDGGGARPRGGTEPAPGQHAETHGGDEDQQGRHHHSSGVAALPEHQLDDVVDREPGQGERLHPDEHRGEASGAA